MPARSAKTPLFLQNLLEQESFLSILKCYVDLNCSILNPTYWVAVAQHQRLQSIFDLEKKYGLTRRLNENDYPHYRKAVREGRPVLGGYLGLYDLFVPVVRAGKYQGMLLTGLFSTEEWSLPLLEKVWSRISGQTAS